MCCNKSFKVMIACITVVYMLSSLVCVSLAEPVQDTGLFGEWVFSFDTSKTVLSLREDGSGVYSGTEVTWNDEGDFLYLEDSEGQSFELRYMLSGNVMTVYLPSMFERISEIGESGQIIGTWKALGSSESSYVFTEDGRFLEDATFTGSFDLDDENGVVTLHYIGGFKDTCIYVSFFDEMLIVEYPWSLTLKN